MTRRIFWGLPLLLLLFATLAPSAPDVTATRATAQELKSSIFAGQVAEVKDGLVKLKVGDEMMKFEINDETMITVNSKEGSVEDIRVGQAAKIDARKVDDGWIASSIDVQIAPK